MNRHYQGQFCSGHGDADFLRLLDESFAFFQPNPVVPNVAMLYKPDWDTFAEGANWNGWWIQNSYGFSYAATPFLTEPWFSILQRSWDLFWDNQGDGKRMGLYGGRPDANRLSPLVAPDGCLGDCARPGEIAYKQGDGDPSLHDWFYEATAAGVVAQAEILLRQRDPAALTRYLPKMGRACDFIERARDPRNDLFLVGPACNLLAPSYGGVRQPDGTFGKGYLAGLSITYLAALDRMIELYRLAGEPRQRALYEQRRQRTRESLARLQTAEGYFVKSLEPDGTPHGVLGRAQFGYLEGVVNVDAVALRVVDEPTSERIYRRIASFPEIRPFDFLLTNAPGLDDTYWEWGSATGPGFEGVRRFGDWVNGGAWGTVEGRAILAYYRLGQFADVYRSAVRAMKWAKDFRMDAPWSQRGENTHNVWSDRGRNQVGGVSVMVDNFAIPAATVRGLFDYDYRADRLILRPRVPASITDYIQKWPVFFGNKTLFLTCHNGGPLIETASLNGRSLPLTTPHDLALPYDELPAQAHVEIITTGGWPPQPAHEPYPATPPPDPVRLPSTLPESLKEHWAKLSALKRRMNADDPGWASVQAALDCIEAWRARAALDPGPGYYRPITPERRQAILAFYEQTALNLCHSPAVSRLRARLPA